MLSFSPDPTGLIAAADGLAVTTRTRRMGRLTIARVDGVEVLGGGALHGPVGQALVGAGFAPTPRGLRLSGQS